MPATLYSEGRTVTATVHFVRERETKNTVRFREVGDEDNLAIGILYVKKATLKAMGALDATQFDVTLVTTRG